MAIELTLDIDAIKAAIKAYIETQGIKTEGKNVDITILNGRGATKNRAQITISDVVAIKHPVGVSDTISQTDIEDIIADDEAIESNTDNAMYLEQDMEVADEREAELDVGQPGNDESLFTKPNPEDAPKPDSLFPEE